MMIFMETIKIEEAKKLTVEDILKKLNSNVEGISEDEAEKRLSVFGPNSIEEEKKSGFIQFMRYFWGPIPWMIEISAVLSVIIGHVIDFSLVMALLVINGLIGYWEEHKASDALESLKKQLALNAMVKRESRWKQIKAENLVPGDIIRVKLGDIIPADIKLISGKYLSVDQSSLTGESLPVSKEKGDAAYSSTIVKLGEMEGIVLSTGSRTYFGRTAELVDKARTKSHFQEAVLRIGNFLIISAILLSAVLITVELIRGVQPLVLVQFILILVIASIPVAMPAVLSVTMALGALSLSKRKAIVSHLQSIEEMAGIDVLCSDKTGTLTKNQLTLGEIYNFTNASQGETLLAAALASERDMDDAIDLAITGGLKEKAELEKYNLEEFVPFDPVRKRTEAEYLDNKGNHSHYTKGAPQVILSLCGLQGSQKDEIESKAL